MELQINSNLTSCAINVLVFIFTWEWGILKKIKQEPKNRTPKWHLQPYVHHPPQEEAQYQKNADPRAQDWTHSEIVRHSFSGLKAVN